MTGHARIRIPWTIRLNRFRRHVLPLLGFATCAVLTTWLWDRQGSQPNAVGEVEAVRIDVAAATDGELLPLPQGNWTLFDAVPANEVIARLDDRPARAELATLQKELIRLQQEVDAYAARIDLEQAGRAHDQRSEAVRLAWDNERHRLQILDRQAAIQGDRIDLQRVDLQLSILKRVFEKGAANKAELINNELLRDKIAKRIELNTAALGEASQQREAAVLRLQKHPGLVSADLARILAPVQTATAVQESRIRELQLRIDSLEIRAPISGTICAIHLWPGQTIRAGDPVVTIAADYGRYIVSYVRQEQRFQPAASMTVDVRLRGSNQRPFPTSVEYVGPQFEEVPVHQRQVPNVPEWGLPVRITLPPSLNARPGALVDIRFKPQTVEDPPGKVTL